MAASQDLWNISVQTLRPDQYYQHWRKFKDKIFLKSGTDSLADSKVGIELPGQLKIWQLKVPNAHPRMGTPATPLPLVQSSCVGHPDQAVFIRTVAGRTHTVHTEGEWGHCKQSTQRQNVSFKHVSSQSVGRWLTSRASCVAKNLCRAILWQILKSSLLTQSQYGVWAYHHRHHLNGQNNISLDTQISSLESRKSHKT